MTPNTVQGHCRYALGVAPHTGSSLDGIGPGVSVDKGDATTAPVETNGGTALLPSA